MFGNKRGSGTLFLVILYVIGAALLLTLALSYLSEAGGTSNFMNALPDGIDMFIEIFGKIVSPIGKAIYFVVAPQGESQNVQVIAFSIFLLLFLVGYKSLRPFFGELTAILVSGIIGVIAGRSLTATILEETALGASPIAAASLLVGFIPIYALSMNIDKWGINNATKFVIFAAAAGVYTYVFGWVFDAPMLGSIYGAAILLLGAGQMIVPYFRKTAREKRGESLGRYMAGVQNTVEDVKAMRKGAAAAGGPAGTP